MFVLRNTRSYCLFVYACLCITQLPPYRLPTTDDWLFQFHFDFHFPNWKMPCNCKVCKRGTNFFSGLWSLFLTFAKNEQIISSKITFRFCFHFKNLWRSLCRFALNHLQRFKSNLISNILCVCLCLCIWFRFGMNVGPKIG